MAYPNVRNKHLADALFHPQDFIKYKKFDKSKFPKKYLILYQTSPYRHLMRKYSGKYKKLPFSTKSTLAIQIGNVGVIKMQGIGSPHAATTMEELIALGGKEFINMGTAGGLENWGNFLCDKAIRDEGTSYHYIPHGKYSYPDKTLTKKLGKLMEKRGFEYSVASTWTIDAPYRETRKEIVHYQKDSVATVEMEASALFAVAAVRKVKIAAAFVVSDVLIGEWDPQFHAKNVNKSLNKLADISLELLNK